MELSFNALGEVSVVANSCNGRYPIEAAVEWQTCMPDPESLGQVCDMALWSYGPKVTRGTSRVNVEGFGNVQVDSGFRYLYKGHWTLIDQDGHVVKNPAV